MEGKQLDYIFGKNKKCLSKKREENHLDDRFENQTHVLLPGSDVIQLIYLLRDWMTNEFELTKVFNHHFMVAEIIQLSLEVICPNLNYIEKPRVEMQIFIVKPERRRVGLKNGLYWCGDHSMTVV